LPVISIVHRLAPLSSVSSGKKQDAAIAPSMLTMKLSKHLCIKKIAKIIGNTENFSNFVLGKHERYSLV